MSLSLLYSVLDCVKPASSFRFEATHLTYLDRIEKLMTLLAIGFVWAHKIGEWRAIQKPIVFNKHKTSRRPQYSYFRYGLDGIRRLLLYITRTHDRLFAFLAKMLCFNTKLKTSYSLAYVIP